MNGLSLETFENRNGFRPGETIEGLVSWELERPAEEIEVRLGWFTSGKGATDRAIVEVIRFPTANAIDVQPFSFVAPDGPSSYDGRLISLTWAIDAVAKAARKQNCRLEIIIAPDGYPLQGTETIDIEVVQNERDAFDM